MRTDKEKSEKTNFLSRRKRTFAAFFAARGGTKAAGMTLIETLVAISVLMVAVSSALTLSSQSLHSASAARDQITASYLAEEGIESARNIRDGNFIKGAPTLWLDGLGPCGSSNGCQIDATNVNPSASACGSGCPVLRYDPATGRYGYSGDWQSSLFTRKIEMDDISGNDDEKLITVTVSWKQSAITRSFSLRETIYNWYK